MHLITARRSTARLIQISTLLTFAAFAGVSNAPAQIAVGISINIAPPVLPVYDQPPIPAPGYIWTPGYWAFDDGDYYWVPGTWVEPPSVGLLWTPGYWGWHDGIYAWNAGYWGPHVGFYGGINYGFGYGGVGYGGGLWRGGVFSYNTTVNNFGGVHITNVYNKTVIVNNNTTNVSFNGGTGGTRVTPTKVEQLATSERHVQPTAAQTQHQQMASTNNEFKAKNNGGHPAVGGTSHAGTFTGEGVSHPHAAGEGGHDQHGNMGGANHVMGENHPAAVNPSNTPVHPSLGRGQPPQAVIHSNGNMPKPPPKSPHAMPNATPQHTPQPRVAIVKPQPPRPAPPRPAPARPAPRPAPHDQHHH
jgi:hypothetical protein